MTVQPMESPITQSILNQLSQIFGEDIPRPSECIAEAMGSESMIGLVFDGCFISLGIAFTSSTETHAFSLDEDVWVELVFVVLGKHGKMIDDGQYLQLEGIFVRLRCDKDEKDASIKYTLSIEQLRALRGSCED